MGCFDTVNFTCPNCKQLTSYQSKIGGNTLSDYSLESAPILVLADVIDEGQKGRLYCEYCSEKISIKIQYLVQPTTWVEPLEDEKWLEQ